MVNELKNIKRTVKKVTNIEIDWWQNIRLNWKINKHGQLNRRHLVNNSLNFKQEITRPHKQSITLIYKEVIKHIKATIDEKIEVNNKRTKTWITDKNFGDIKTDEKSKIEQIVIM